MVEYYEPYLDVSYSDFHSCKYLKLSENIVKTGWGCFGANWALLDTSEPYVTAIDYYPYVLELVCALYERCSAINKFYTIRVPTHGEDVTNTLHIAINDIYACLGTILEYHRWVVSVSDSYNSEVSCDRHRMFPLDYAPTSSAYYLKNKTIYTYTRSYLNKQVSDTYPVYGKVDWMYTESGDIVINNTVDRLRHPSRYTIYAVRYLHKAINKLTKLATIVWDTRDGEHQMNYGTYPNINRPIPLSGSSSETLFKNQASIENALSFNTLSNDKMDAVSYQSIVYDRYVNINDPLKNAWTVGTYNPYMYRVPTKFHTGGPYQFPEIVSTQSYDGKSLLIFRGNSAELSIESTGYLNINHIALISENVNLENYAATFTPVYAKPYMNNIAMSSSRLNANEAMYGKFGTTICPNNRPVRPDTTGVSIPIFFYDNSTGSSATRDKVVKHITEHMPDRAYIGLEPVGASTRTVPIMYLNKSRAYDLLPTCNKYPSAISYDEGRGSFRRYTRKRVRNSGYYHYESYSHGYTSEHSTQFGEPIPTATGTRIFRLWDIITSNVYNSGATHTKYLSAPSTDAYSTYVHDIKYSVHDMMCYYSSMFSQPATQARWYHSHTIKNKTVAERYSYVKKAERSMFGSDTTLYDFTVSNRYSESIKSDHFRCTYPFQRISYIFRRSKGFSISRKISVYGRIHHKTTKNCNTVHPPTLLSEAGFIGSGSYYDFMNLSVITDVTIQSILHADRHKVRFISPNDIYETAQGMHTEISYSGSTATSSLLSEGSVVHFRGYRQKKAYYRYKTTRVNMYICSYVIEDFTVSGGFYFKSVT